MTDPVIEKIRLQTFYLIDPSHRLNWYCDDVEKPRILLLVSPCDKIDVFDVEGISVRSWDKTDSGSSLSFLVNNEEYSTVFLSFYHDVIKKSRDIDPEDGPKFAFELFQFWVNSFKVCHDLLRPEEIQGLIGELVAIRDILIPKFGPANSINSWMNRFRNKQDFIFDECWCEVKTIMEGSLSIKISSLDQLNRYDSGKLIIISLRHVSKDYIKKVTLNSLYDDLCDLLKDHNLVNIFKKTIELSGYVPDPRYDDFSFEISSTQIYDVSDKFPRLTRDNVPAPAIVAATYDIALNALVEFEVKKWI